MSRQQLKDILVITALNKLNNVSNIEKRIELGRWKNKLGGTVGTYEENILILTPEGFVEYVWDIHETYGLPVLTESTQGLEDIISAIDIANYKLDYKVLETLNKELRRAHGQKGC